MAEQLFQIGVKAIIRNKKGEVLLLTVPQWGGNAAHYDFPGGRMDAGETFIQTLRRELKEEIGIDYNGSPKFVMTVLSNITIPVGDTRVPLVLMAYEVELDSKQKPVSLEENATIEWHAPAKAAELLANKYPADFCGIITKL